MVTAGTSPRSTAKRIRRSSGAALTRGVLMEVVECAQCGDRYTIGHDPAFQDAQLAKRQATWLADRFVWDHIQESRHPGSIDLPSSAEMK